MTCAHCAAKIKKTLLEVPGITSVDIDIQKKEAVVGMSRHSGLGVLNQALHKAGNYRLSEGPAPSALPQEPDIKKFVPLIVIFSIIIVLTFLKQGQTGSWHGAMLDFMGFFFVIFGGFKIINWKGFVESYRTYDVLAKKSEAYAYAYPLIELGLGIAYLMRFELTLTNWITVLVMGVSTIGVARALMAKRKIVCACLGAVFKIPMTKVTLLEDVLMLIMASLMLIQG